MVAQSHPNPAHDASGESPVIFTIGHSNHALDRLLDLLADHRIDVVADVRTAPFSRFNPHFNREPLARGLRASGVDYVFLGRELGGRPDDRNLYDDDGHVRYDLLATTDLFEQGLRRLLAGASKHRVALLCSEGDPAQCHRHLLIARVLHERGVHVAHIEPDGSEHDYEVVAERTAEQRTLFAGEEDRLWRSPRSVLQSTAPSRSSDD